MLVCTGMNSPPQTHTNTHTHTHSSLHLAVLRPCPLPLVLPSLLCRHICGRELDGRNFLGHRQHRTTLLVSIVRSPQTLFLSLSLSLYFHRSFRASYETRPWLRRPLRSLDSRHELGRCVGSTARNAGGHAVIHLGCLTAPSPRRSGFSNLCTFDGPEEFSSTPQQVRH